MKKDVNDLSELVIIIQDDIRTNEKNWSKNQIMNE